MPNVTPVPATPSAPPGTGASHSSHADSSPATSFMDVLTDHQARTDLPEGQVSGDDTPQATSEQQAPTAPADDAVTAPAVQPDADPATTAAAEALAAALSAVPVAAPAVAVSVADTPAAAASATGSAVPAAPGAVVAALAQQTAAPAEAAPVDAAPVEAAPAQAAPVQAAPAQADAGKPAALPTVPDASAPAPTPVAPQQPQQQVQQSQQPAAQPQAAPVDAAPATPQNGADQQQQPTGQDAGAQPQAQQAPTVPNGIQQPAPVHHHVTPVAPVLHAMPLRTAEAVEKIHGLVQLASQNGTAQARMELHPAELGGVTIQLRVTAAGLQAHISADRPEALPLLQQAGDDLRKALVDRGVEVSHLDFGMHGGAENGAWREQSRAQQELADGFGTLDLGDDVAEETLAISSVGAPAGALVDVKA